MRERLGPSDFKALSSAQARDPAVLIFYQTHCQNAIQVNQWRDQHRLGDLFTDSLLNYWRPWTFPIQEYTNPIGVWQQLG